MKEIIDSADDSSVSCCHAALESGQIDHEDCIEMRQSATVEVEARTPLHALYGDDGPIIIDLNGPIRRSGRPPGRRRRSTMTEKTEEDENSARMDDIYAAVANLTEKMEALEEKTLTNDSLREILSSDGDVKARKVMSGYF